MRSREATKLVKMAKISRPGSESTSASERKRAAMLEAAENVFLRGGYLGTNMDEIAALSGVSKQTVYKHFGSKEALFIEIVTAMMHQAGDAVLNEVPELAPDGELEKYLQDYAYQQLTLVLTPRLMQLRRLVIGEVGRFPELAEILYEGGPRRAVAALALVFEKLAARKLLNIDDPVTAASHFNWLFMSAPLNQAMLLGDAAIPGKTELRRQAAEGARIFLAAYGRKD